MGGARPPTIDQPGHREPAPGGLGLVQAFLNSVDIEGQTDAFSDRKGLTRWLQEWGLLPPEAAVSERDRRRTIAMREALRDVVEARDAGRDAFEAAARLERSSRRSPLVVRLSADGVPALHPKARGVDAAIARLLSEASLAAAEGTWLRLKICRNDVCRWAFFDASRNRSGAWCSMAVCGNRLKGRAFRSRRRRALSSTSCERTPDEGTD